jgi:hypothetical protein
MKDGKKEMYKHMGKMVRKGQRGENLTGYGLNNRSCESRNKELAEARLVA